MSSDQLNFTESLQQAGDFDSDFDPVLLSTQVQGFKKELDDMIQLITAELIEVMSTVTRSGPRLHLLEVYCSDHSELTKQTNNLGYRDARHGFAQGDLSTIEGRRQLFQTICRQDPSHLWYSPTCKPWCSWSILNELKSLSQFDQVHQQRRQHLHQLALGLVLYRYQCARRRHMHWEQPARSLMFRSPLLSELTTTGLHASFDMCRVGALRDPVTQQPIRKGMEIITTSPQVQQALHGRTCRKDHQHQSLEGTTLFHGKRINRTEFSEHYPRKFARLLAKTMTKVQTLKEPPHDVDAVLVAPAKRSAPRRLSTMAKRAKLTPNVMVGPEELPSKRVRLTHKQEGEDHKNPKELSHRITDAVIGFAPRVGRFSIDQPAIVKDIQDLLHDKEIVRVVGCKGTERTIPPPKDLPPEEAPYRRAIVVQRGTKDVVIEKEWEHWQYLSERQLLRRFHPGFLNITVFARNPEHQSAQPSQPSAPIQPPERLETSGVPQSLAPEEPALSEPAAAINGQAGSIGTETHAPHSGTHEQVDIVSKDHGPKYMVLSSDQKQLVARLHKNLGHPAPATLSQVLKQQGYAPEIVQGVHDFKCSVCQMQKVPSIPRPATLKSDYDFGDKVTLDGITWTNKQGEEYHFYHYLDYGTNYHTAIIAPRRNAEQAMEKFISGWMMWAGPPNECVMDSASEFVSEQFSNFLSGLNVKCTIAPPEAHWQVGKIERHGDILQGMLAKYDLEHSIDSYPALQQALMQCTMAKNAAVFAGDFPQTC